MSDIFLSYAIQDWEKAGTLARLFKQNHLTVWKYDYVVRAGGDSEEMLKELEGAKVVITLWSRAALLKYQPRVGQIHEGQVLVPVLLEKITLPPGFTVFRTFDLSDWNRVSWNTGLEKLLRHIRALIAMSSFPTASPITFEELTLSEIRENAQLGIREGADTSPEGNERFKGVFISYRRSEASAYAGRLYDRLAARFGKEKVFIDTENVGWGEDFVEVIEAAAESCAVMIALISSRWARGAGGQEGTDDYVRLEVAKALGRKIRVIPILIQGASMPAPKELPEDLAPLVRRNALALSDTRWERDVEDLIKSLESLLKD